MHNLKELKIWHKAIELTTEVYRLTAEFPKEEKYGLTSQVRQPFQFHRILRKAQGAIQIKSLFTFLESPMALHMNFKHNSLFLKILVS
jgi:hypothetical protein